MSELDKRPADATFLADGSCELVFDASVYSLETLQRAALKYTNLCSFAFHASEQKLAVVIHNLSTGIKLDAEAIIPRFRNEVLDQHLRAIIAKECEAERNLILAYAFSNTKLLNSR